MSRTLPMLLLMLAALSAACVTDLRVGVEQAADAGAPDAGPVTADAAVGPCQPADCTVPPLKQCGDSEPVCERNELGVCEWHSTGECPDDSPCTPADCDVVLLRPDLDAFACSNGSEPVCTRDERGLCSYVCEKQFSCGTAEGAGCGAGKYCAFDVGKCSGESGGLCTDIPSSCAPDDSPVCGCDGNTYANPCEAMAKGVNVAFAGSCDGAPKACTTCEGEVPPEPTECEGDGSHKTGATCLQGPSGACVWQWLACPSVGSCGALMSDLASGRCFSDADCQAGQKCEGASVCPCASECFAPETPGYCK